MNIFRIENTLLHAVTTGALISKVKKAHSSELFIHTGCLKCFNASNFGHGVLIFDDFTHHIDILHNSTIFIILIVDIHIIPFLTFHGDIDQSLILHCIKFIFLFLNIALEINSFCATHENLAAKIFNNFLFLEQDALHYRNRLTGELGIVIL